MRTIKQTCFLLFFLFSTAYAQESIKGYIIDAETRLPLMYATVQLYQTPVGAVTNSEGFYELEFNQESWDSLLVTFVGYRDTLIHKSDISDSIVLEPAVFSLNEVVVLPLTALEQVKRTISKIDSNYSQTGYNSNCYFREVLYENDAPVGYTEALLELYHPGIQDSSKVQGKVIHAQELKGLKALEFMRKDRLKDKRKSIKKEMKAAKKRGEEYQPEELDEDEQRMFSMLGGPENVMSMDPIRNPEFFLNKKFLKKTTFWYAGQVEADGRQIVIIEYSQKKYESVKSEGKLYIDLATDALLAMDFTGVAVIPSYVKPILFIKGLSISNPTFSMRIEYQWLNGKFYPKQANVIVNIDMIKRRIFSSNDKSKFLVKEDIVILDVTNFVGQEIPDHLRHNPDEGLTMTGDPGFWETFERPVN